MEKIRAVIVDDEEEAREGMKSLLSQDPDIWLIAVCSDGVQAIKAINETSPDLVFLDIQMPEVNGFDVLNSLQPECMPAVIFATAYDQYAVKAFDLHAIDYLLKPFTNKRFYESLALAKARIRNASLQHINQKLSVILAGYAQEKDTQEADVLIHQNAASLADKLVIKSSGKIYFIPKKEIVWIEAYDSYVKIHIGGKYHLVRESMKNIEEKLPENVFARIHKSSIVNINFITELEPYFNGEFVVKLTNGTELKLSRSYRSSFMGLFEK